MSENPSRIRVNVSTSVKGVLTWDTTVECNDPYEPAEAWQQRQAIVQEQMTVLITELRTRYGQGELLLPDLTEITSISIERGVREAQEEHAGAPMS